MRSILLLMMIVMLTSLPAKIAGIHAVDGEKIRIAVSIYPLKLILSPLVEPYAEVTVFIPEGVEPHMFQATPEVMSIVEDSDLVVMTGHLPAEFKVMESVKRPYVSIEDYRLNGLRLLNYPGGGGVNVHGYWLLPDNALAVARAVIERLLEIDPDHAKYYLSNLKRFEENIHIIKKIIDEEISEKGLENVKVVLSVAAEQYIAEAFSLEPVAVISKEHDVAIGGTELMKAVKALSRDEKAFIIMSDMAEGTKAGEVALQISADTGKPVVRLRLMSVSGFDDYLSMLMLNLGKVVAGARASVSPREGPYNGVLISALAALLFVCLVEGVLLLGVMRKI